MLFKNWVKSGFIYVKDLLNGNGSWKTEKEITNKLLVKCNWMTELLSIKHVLRKFLEDKDVSACRYIQHTLLERLTFTSRSKIYNITIETLNSKLFYTILLNKKFEKTYVEKIWEKRFNISLCNSDWQIIYMTNFKELKYRKFSEFKYKILHNILPCGKLVARWNKDIPPYCDFCKETEDVQHMLYFCSRIKTIWMNLGPLLHLDIALKHIILGLQGISSQNEVRNIVIVIVMYAIYCTWVKCNVEKISYSEAKVMQLVKEYISFYTNVFCHIFQDRRKSQLLKMYKEKICNLYLSV